MANFKRRRPRTRTHRPHRGSQAHWRAKHGLKPVRINWRDYEPNRWQDDLWSSRWHPYLNMMNSVPNWFDILYNRRRKRRAIQRCLIAIREGADPDDVAWPLGNRKPSECYW